MSYSTNPVIDAARYWEPRYAAADRQQQAEASMSDDFLSACRHADANALAPWAPQVTDYTGKPYAVGAARPRRLQTLAECMTDALDYLDAHTELHQLLLNAAAGADVRAQATALLARLADGFASRYADGGE